MTPGNEPGRQLVLACPMVSPTQAPTMKKSSKELMRTDSKLGRPNFGCFRLILSRWVLGVSYGLPHTGPQNEEI